MRLSRAARRSPRTSILDFDAKGRAVGIEVLFVSELPDANPLELAFKVHRERSDEAA